MGEIKGYRQLSDLEVALVNHIKAHAEVVGKLVDEITHYGSSDTRWAAIARTELQQGFMALVRAITKPTTF